jgi:hypothetical protein
MTIFSCLYMLWYLVLSWAVTVRPSPWGGRRTPRRMLAPSLEELARDIQDDGPTVTQLRRWAQKWCLYYGYPLFFCSFPATWFAPWEGPTWPCLGACPACPLKEPWERCSPWPWSSRGPRSHLTGETHMSKPIPCLVVFGAFECQEHSYKRVPLA